LNSLPPAGREIVLVCRNDFYCLVVVGRTTTGSLVCQYATDNGVVLLPQAFQEVEPLDLIRDDLSKGCQFHEDDVKCRNVMFPLREIR
jgi:hypothetical protein